jgi:GNAT superfamily N-acetyltransferase
MNIGRLRTEHIPQWLALAKAVDWQWTHEQALLYLASGDVHGTWMEGELVATAGLYGQGEMLRWLGVVMVHPMWQRRGLGTRIVLHVLDAVRVPIGLVATTRGRPLYEKLGFTVVGEVYRMMRSCDNGSGDRRYEDYRSRSEDIHIRPLKRSDTDVVDYDRRVTALFRPAMHEALWSGIQTGIRIGLRAESADGRCVGIAWASRHHDTLVVGPLFAADLHLAYRLLLELGQYTQAWKINRWVMDVPAEQAAWVNTLTRRAWRKTFVSAVMVRGTPQLPDERDHLFAMAAPALG